MAQSLLKQPLHLTILVNVQLLLLQLEQEVEVLQKLLVIRQLIALLPLPPYLLPPLLLFLLGLSQEVGFCLLQVVLVPLEHRIVEGLAVFGAEGVVTSGETVETELLLGELQRDALRLRLKYLTCSFDGFPLHLDSA